MNKKFWDIYAPIYERAMRADRKIYAYMYNRIPQVIAGKKVLEIATGPGLLAKRVAHAADKMIATDYSSGMIREAQKGTCPQNLSFEVVDARNLPYEEDSFDAVLIANALHLIPEPEQVLVEIRKVLKEDGILIAPNFVEHNKGVISRIWSTILKIVGVRFEQQWSAEEYKAFLQNNGWNLVKCQEMQARIPIVYVECVKSR